ncbi:unnamed protein product [Owenia fusiformis]|uniref:Uncharacterized protein n=1 Tax=Owenia fusiformis TaxID=6347 RepID=A0A8J1U2L7_OWEFU|nr:unnamed protein product [Owenia fusiformis]
MGNGVSTALVRIGKPGERLSEDEVELASNCLNRLPVVYKGYNNVPLEEISMSWELYKVKKSTIIARAQGDMTMEGIFIILDGTIELLSDKDRLIVAGLQKGEFVGDVPTVFEKPCAATCRAKKDTKLLFLSKSSLTPTILSVEITMDEWLVKRMFLACTGKEREHIARRITVRVLQRIPLFRKWGLISLQMLVDYMRNPIIIYPNKAKLIMEGDPSEALLVVLRGEIGIYEQNNLIQRIGPSLDTFPIWIGEEGLLSGEVRPFTLRAHSICQIIVIQKNTIESVAEVRTGDAGQAWEYEQKSCKERISRRDENLYIKHKAFLQYETILLNLKSRNIDRFANFTVQNLWHIATKSTVKHLKKDSTFSQDKTLDILIYVLTGSLRVESFDDENDNDVFNMTIAEGQLFDPRTLSKDGKDIAATQSTLLLEIPSAVVAEAENLSEIIELI